MNNLDANVIATDDLFLGIDLIWSDGHGLGVRGWALSRRDALEEISLCVDSVTVPITKWYPRPDLLAVFPQCRPSDRCGLEVHVSRQAQYGLAFQVQRQGKTIVLPMKVAASSPLRSDYTDASNLINEFLAIGNAPGMRVLEIGSRIVSPGIRRDLAAHEVFTVGQAGLKGFKNGALLRAAAGRFDVLITVDKSIPNQQNLVRLGSAVLILRAKTNSYPDLKPLAPQALAALARIQPGEIVTIKS